MRRLEERHLVLIYIALAAGCVAIGTGLTFALLAICAYYQIDLTLNWWLLILPLASTLAINVLLIEVIRRFVGK